MTPVVLSTPIPATLSTLLAKARQRSLFIATPIARRPVCQYTMALAQTLVVLQALGIRCTARFAVADSNLARARNTLCAAFMASGDYTDMLLIDDDIGFDPDSVVRLLGSDHDLIAGVCPKKTLTTMLPDTDPSKWLVATLEPPHRCDDLGALEVEAVGTGFMRIRRSVFYRMKAAHPEWKRRGDGLPDMPALERAEYYQYFRFDPDDPQERGEDVRFCHDFRALGGTVWLDPAIRLLHVGEHEYSGDFGVILEMLKRNATA